MASISKKITYITKDRERAEGMAENEAYSIISGNGTKDTHEILLEQTKIDGSLVVFKNNKVIEDLAKEKGFDLLNPKAELSEEIENKITQVKWLGELASLLPPHSISETQNIKWGKRPFILQWAHSHTGEGTYFIQKEEDLKELKDKFPLREARATDFIKGPMFTLNIVVSDKTILLGNISYQITGMLPFTANPFSTVGNDWSLPHTILTDVNIEEIKNIAKKVADKMKNSGWLGLFGIDIIYNEETDKIHLIEINARQPASTTFESQLQMKIRGSGVNGITVFEAHIKALSHESIDLPIIEINDGAQIVQRVTNITKKADKDGLVKAGYNVIEYNNTKTNSDLVRIQSDKGIMETHNKFNVRGKEILDLVSK